MSREVVDARLVGGSLFVGLAAGTELETLVLVEGPGYEIPLRPQEARELAQALIATLALADESISPEAPC